MTPLRHGDRMALKYADEIAAFRIGDIVHTRGQANRPTWIIEAFEPHQYRLNGMSAIVRSLKTGRVTTRDVVDIARTTSTAHA